MCDLLLSRCIMNFVLAKIRSSMVSCVVVRLSSLAVEIVGLGLCTKRTFVKIRSLSVVVWVVNTLVVSPVVFEDETVAQIVH